MSYDGKLHLFEIADNYLMFIIFKCVVCDAVNCEFLWPVPSACFLIIPHCVTQYVSAFTHISWL